MEIGCVILVIAQWYNCSITSFLLRMRLKALENDWNEIQISVFEKRAPLRRQLLQFIRTGKYLFKDKVLEQKILEQRLLLKLTFTGSDLNNSHSQMIICFFLSLRRNINRQSEVFWNIQSPKNPKSKYGET